MIEAAISAFCAAQGAMYYRGRAVDEAEIERLFREHGSAFIPYVGTPPMPMFVPPTARPHRCAYCRTLATAAERCPSCGAPR